MSSPRLRALRLARRYRARLENHPDDPNAIHHYLQALRLACHFAHAPQVQR